MPNIQLANNLRYLRKKRNLRQEDIGNILNISRQAYSNYENCTRTPDLDTLLQLCDFYKVSLDNLVLEDFKNDLYSAGSIFESISSYHTGIDKNTGNKIYLSREEMELLINYRSLSEENRKIITGFIKAYSTD